MSGVLVTQVQSRGGLSVIRSLGARGIRVTASDSDRLALGFFSRYASRHFRYPDPDCDSGVFADRILQELAAHQYDVLMPMYDETLMPLSRRSAEIERLTRFPFLGFQALSDAQDKESAVRIARSCGLRVPRTWSVTSEADVVAARQEAGVPLIVRPRRSQASRGLHRVDHRDMVWPMCQTIQRAYGAVIVQEYVPWGGYTYDVDVLMNRDSEVRALVVCKRLRTYPPLAGPTSCGQAVLWPELADMAVALLQRMRWYGPAEVEFRVDPRDGRPTFMEVNPRLWGSLHTSTVAGVDFPYMLYRLALDGDVSPVLHYRTDMRARYFLTLDLLCMAFHPNRRSILRAWLSDFVSPRTKDYLVSWRDPLPLAGRILAGAAYGIRPARIRERLGRARAVR